MNKHKFFVLAALALALFLSALQLNGAALASHPVQEITFSYRLVNTVDPGISWTDTEGLHIRNRVDIGILSGDIAGTARVVDIADLAPLASPAGLSRPAPQPSSGVAYGSIQVFSDGMEVSLPIWQGTWRHDIRNGLAVSGEMTAYSLSGDLVLLVDGVSQSAGGSITYTGYIDHLYCPAAGCSAPASE